MTQPPRTMQLAGRADWALMIAIHDALRRDLDQLLHATAGPASDIQRRHQRSANSREPGRSHRTDARPVHRAGVAGSGQQARPVL